MVASSIVNVRNEDNDSGDVGGDKESGFFGGCRVVGEDDGGEYADEDGGGGDRSSGDDFAAWGNGVCGGDQYEAAMVATK